MSRVATYWGIERFSGGRVSRVGRMDLPIFQFNSGLEYVNPKEYEILPGETLSIHNLTTEPGFDAWVLIPRTPPVSGAMPPCLDVWVQKDTSTSNTNLAPSGENRRWFCKVNRFPFVTCLSGGDALVNETLASDYQVNGATGLAKVIEAGSVPGFIYKILVHYPAVVRTPGAWGTFTTQTDPIKFTTCLVQGRASTALGGA